jgi:hypothetical protein
MIKGMVSTRYSCDVILNGMQVQALETVLAEARAKIKALQAATNEQRRQLELAERRLEAAQVLG